MLIKDYSESDAQFVRMYTLCSIIKEFVEF